MEIDENVQIIIDCLQVGGIGLILMIAAYSLRLKYEVEGYRRYVKDNGPSGFKYTWIFVVLGAALVIKIFLAAHYKGYDTDMNCFYSWADMIYDNGFSKFYGLDAFTDYPPGYMVFLWIGEFISRIFDIETATTASRVIIKLFPILADLGAGFVLYKIAKEKLSEGSSCLVAGIYVLSTIVLMDSSVWGQTDSVFTLCVLLTAYLCMKKKRIPAYFTFVVGSFIKPQTLIFAPLLIWVIIEQVFLTDFSWKKFANDLVGGLLAIGTFFLMSLPFGLGKVLAQYAETLVQYPYGTVNAFNLWGLLGKNWVKQEETISVFGIHIQLESIGIIAIFLAIVLSGVAFFKLRKKNDQTRYFISAAMVIATMFIFSVRMHERYMFPIVVLLFAAFVVKPTKELFFTSVGFAFVQFMNVAIVYKNCAVHGSASAPSGGVIGVTALLTIGLFGYLWFAMGSKCRVCEFAQSVKANGRKAVKRFISERKEDVRPEKPEPESFEIKPSKKVPKFTKYDWIVLGAIIFVYSAFALFDLGYTDAPQTELRADDFGYEINLDLGSEKKVDMMYTYLGFYENRKFDVDFSNDKVNYETAGELQADSVFSWCKIKTPDEEQESYNLSNKYRYIRLTCNDSQLRLRELVILDDNKEIITPVNTSDYPELFDEQDCFENPVTFRSSTYFDEIYHARTAMEMVEGDVRCYENTHPPLGKWLISLGVRMFGMTPFGWRIVGTIFGILMLPLLYVFARRLFKGKTWAAGAATGLFAFDFMHFTQTRISTIDVYVTFFVIAMFLFMYWYSTVSFYDTKLYKTWIPLGLCAISMGLGCASKWPGVYAGLGLAVAFFWVIIRRYREYRIAKADPLGSTAGIEHQHIIDVFKKNTLLTLGFCVLFFVIIAGTIYTLSYLAFSDGTDAGLIDQMLKNQTDMFNYHSTLKAEHSFSSMWYEWPLMIRPVYYFTQETLSGLKQGITSFGNPLVWWPTIPVVLYMIYRVFRYRDRKAGFLTLGFAAQYLPWTLVTRCTFIYHFFPSVPFVVLMIVYTMVKVDEKDKAWRKWIYAYFGISFLLFLMFYPVLAGQPADAGYIRDGLRWLDSWILG
ncbi:MAG: glycosyltransferase family 39 protein [Eubacterium sp.]|nr:glycosyltransferase family 39 protein [Eubacterium sp.]